MTKFFLRDALAYLRAGRYSMAYDALFRAFTDSQDVREKGRIGLLMLECSHVIHVYGAERVA